MACVCVCVMETVEVVNASVGVRGHPLYVQAVVLRVRISFNSKEGGSVQLIVVKPL